MSPKAKSWDYMCIVDAPGTEQAVFGSCVCLFPHFNDYFRFL